MIRERIPKQCIIPEKFPLSYSEICISLVIPWQLKKYVLSI